MLLRNVYNMQEKSQILFKIKQNVAFFPVPEPFCDPKICLKSVCGRGSAPDPAGGAHDAPPDPLVGWGGAKARGSRRRKGQGE